MKTIIQILALHPVRSIRIENPGYMALCIEHIGTGPRGLPAVSVAHYGEQNGDAMRDPEMCFEIAAAATPGQPATWEPYYFRNDYAGIEQEVYSRDDADRLLVRPRLLAELRTFARQWSANLRDQGFIKAAAKTNLHAALNTDRFDQLVSITEAGADAPLVAPAFETQVDFLAPQLDIFSAPGRA